MISKLKQRLASDEGFTLIELLVVIVILGILLAIAVPSYLGFKDRANKTAAQANVRAAVPSVEAFYSDNGTYVGMDLAPCRRSTPASRSSEPSSADRGRATASRPRRASYTYSKTGPAGDDHCGCLHVSDTPIRRHCEGRERSRPSSFWRHAQVGAGRAADRTARDHGVALPPCPAPLAAGLSPSRVKRIAELGVAGRIVAISFAARSVAALRSTRPAATSPTSTSTASLARGLAETGRLEIRGHAAHFPALLEPILAAPFWLGGDPAFAYRATLLLHAARDVARRRAGLPARRGRRARRPHSALCALLAVAAPALVYTSLPHCRRDRLPARPRSRRDLRRRAREAERSLQVAPVVLSYLAMLRPRPVRDPSRSSSSSPRRRRARQPPPRRCAATRSRSSRSRSRWSSSSHSARTVARLLQRRRRPRCAPQRDPALGRRRRHAARPRAGVVSRLPRSSGRSPGSEPPQSRRRGRLQRRHGAPRLRPPAGGGPLRQQRLRSLPGALPDHARARSPRPPSRCRSPWLGGSDARGRRRRSSARVHRARSGHGLRLRERPSRTRPS